HGEEGGVAAHRGGAGAGGDGLGVLPSGFAQVGVEVDQSGQGDRSGGVDDLGAVGVQAGADRLDAAGGQQQVGGLAAQHAGAADQVALGVGHLVSPCCAGPWMAPPSSRYSTAMRTLTPLVTCSTTVERAESATSAEISMPRTIGPGCMTMAWSAIRAKRSASRP